MSSTSGILSSVSGMEAPGSGVKSSSLSSATAASRANRSRCYSITILSSSEKLDVSGRRDAGLLCYEEGDARSMWSNIQDMILTDCNHACQQEVTPRSIRTIIAALVEQDMYFNEQDTKQSSDHTCIWSLEFPLFAYTSSPLTQLISVLRREPSVPPYFLCRE